jgi:hypothetical protein
MTKHLIFEYRTAENCSSCIFLFEGRATFITNARNMLGDRRRGKDKHG